MSRLLSGEVVKLAASALQPTNCNSTQLILQTTAKPCCWSTSLVLRIGGLPLTVQRNVLDGAESRWNINLKAPAGLVTRTSDSRLGNLRQKLRPIGARTQTCYQLQRADYLQCWTSAVATEFRSRSHSFKKLDCFRKGRGMYVRHNTKSALSTGHAH